ncbi:hypothetical protein PIB30_054137 [Stylosanthes scabra]|uniref:Clathrin assembly protein n=1 Tax=Stylosanthes scabra TaxID=79078 RepID=A0ABU6XH80_9FABA|nr:hypothetical protein [Stylosanthes scabra]
MRAYVGNNSNNLALSNIGDTTGWELALVTAQSNHTSQAPDQKMAGGFDKLLLDSLYEDENARRQLQLQNAGYGYGGNGVTMQNPFESENDPFAMSNNIAPPTSVQLAIQQQQEQMLFQQQQQHNSNMMMNPYQQQQPYFNPFGDPLPIPNYAYNTTPSQGNYNLM